MHEARGWSPCPPPPPPPPAPPSCEESQGLSSSLGLGVAPSSYAVRRCPGGARQERAEERDPTLQPRAARLSRREPDVLTQALALRLFQLGVLFFEPPSLSGGKENHI